MKGRKQESGIIWLLYVFSIMAYYLIVQQYWFLRLTGGFLVKIWVGNVLMLSLVFIRLKILDSERKAPLKFGVDYTYPLILLLLIWAMWDCIALYSHGRVAKIVLKYMLVSFSPACIFLSIIILLREDAFIVRLLKLIFFVGLLNAIGVELRFSSDPYFSPLKISTGAVYEFGGGASINLLLGENLSRHGKELVGVNTYASWLMSLPLVGYFLGTESNRRYFKWLYYLSSVFILYAINMAATRAVFFGMFVGFLVFVWFNRRLWSARRAMFIVVSLIIVTVSTMWYSNAMTIRLLELATRIPVLSQNDYIRSKLGSYGMSEGHMGKGTWDDPHFGRFSAVFGYISKSPLFGVGWKKQYEINEHNWYIQQLAIYGGITFILIILFFSSLLYRIWKVLRMEMVRGSPNASIGILLFSLIIGALVYLNASPGENMHIWVLLGLGVAWSRNAFERQRANARLVRG